MHSARSIKRNALRAQLPEAAALFELYRPLEAFLDRDDVTELVINEPGSVFLESAAGWERHAIDSLSFACLMNMARVAATFSGQSLTREHPIISCTLPTGERMQIVIPPATRPGTVSITIRKPSEAVFTLSDYSKSGAFSDCRDATGELDPSEKELVRLKARGDYQAFIELAVRSRKNILISGATGSGKTTFARAVVSCIPDDERLLSIENVDELKLWKTHPNSVSLFYSAGGQGIAQVSPKELMESALRMKPDRVLLAEIIRGEEAFYFLRNVGSGHPGSITTMHGNSCLGAVDQLITMMKECTAGSSMTRTELKDLILSTVDVIIQFKRVGGVRKITEIYYEPTRY